MKKSRFLPLAVFALLGVFTLTQRSNAATVNALLLVGDPNSYFDVPYSPSFAGSLKSTFTIEAWVNPSPILAFPGPDTQGYIIMNKEDSYELGVNPATDGSNKGTFQIAVQPTSGSWAWFDSTGAVPGGVWTHVAATYDGTAVRTFVNGKFLAKDTSVTGDLNDINQSHLFVGRRVRGDATLHQIFGGLITEIRISNNIRYTESGYTVPTKQFASDANTMALYHFDAQTNGVVMDASSKGNNGMLLQDATIVPAVAIPITP